MPVALVWRTPLNPAPLQPWRPALAPVQRQPWTGMFRKESQSPMHEQTDWMLEFVRIHRTIYNVLFLSTMQLDWKY